MIIKDVNIDWKVWESGADLVIYREDGNLAADITFTLSELEQFQKLCVIAAAKLRGKLAKDIIE